MTADALHVEQKLAAVPTQAAQTTTAAGDGGSKGIKRKQLLTSFENELTATKKRFFTGNAGNVFEIWTRYADKFATADDRTGFYAKIVETGNYLAANGDCYAASWQCFQFVLELLQLHGSLTQQHGGDADTARIQSVKTIQTTEQLRKAFFVREFPDKTVVAPQKKMQSSRRRRVAPADALDETRAHVPKLDQAAKKLAARMTELKLSALQGYLDAEIEVLNVNDARLRFPASVNEALTLLNLVRCLMQLFSTAASPANQQLPSASFLQRYFVYFYNASILTFKVCRMLMSAGHLREALDYIAWTAVAFDSNPSSTPNDTTRFLTWRTNLHYAAAKCLIALDCTNDACEFIRNWAVKCVAEAHAKEYERSGAQRTQEVRAVFRLACHRLNSIIFRQRILRLKRKGQTRPGAPAAAPTPSAGGRKRFHFGRSAAAAANDKHRSQVERIMCELFEGFTAQFAALTELLDRSASARVLETCPPAQPEDAELYTEIFEYANFLLFGTTHGRGGEAHPRARSTSRSTPPDHSADQQQAPPVSMKVLFDCEYGEAVCAQLITASAVGASEIPLHSCIDFALQCFNYEQFDLFEAVRKKLGEIVAVNSALPEYQPSSSSNDLIVSRMRVLSMLSLVIDSNVMHNVRKHSAGRAMSLISFAKQTPNVLTTDLKTQLCTLLTYFLFEQPQQTSAQQQMPLSQHPDAEILRDSGLMLWYQQSFSTVKLNLFDLPNHYPLELGENNSKTSANALERRVRQLHIVWHLLVRLEYHLIEPLEMTAMLYELIAAMDVFLHTVNMMHKRVNVSSRFGAARLNLSTATSTLSEMVQLLRQGLSIIGSSRTIFKNTLKEVNLPSISTGAGGPRNRLLYNLLLDIYTELYFVHQRYVILHAMLVADNNAKSANDTGKTSGHDAAVLHGRNWKARALHALQAALVSYAIKSTTPAATTVVAERLRTSISESSLPDARGMLEEAYKCLRKAKDEEDAHAQSGMEVSIFGGKNAVSEFESSEKDESATVNTSPPNETKNADDFNALNESGPPPPPIAVEITDTSMTLMPAPYKPVDGVAWYKILGREFAEGVKVRLKDVKLQGTNIDRRVASANFDCCFRVTGLRPNQRYIFACAAFDASGRLIWNSVGRTTRPLTAAHPLSTDYCMGLFCRVAHHIGAFNLCRLSFKDLWDKFCGFGFKQLDHPPLTGTNGSDAVTVFAEQLALQTINEETEKDLSLAVDGVNMSSIQVRNFVVCCLLEAEVCMTSNSSSLAVIGAGVLGGKTVELIAQSHTSRIKACWRMVAAMRLAVWLNDDLLAADALVECILMLTPLFHSKIYVVNEALQILHWCHVVLTHIRRDLAAMLSRMMQRICRYWPQLMVTGNSNTLSAAAAAAAAVSANRTSLGSGRSGGRNTTTFADNTSTVNNNARVLTERFACVLQVLASFYYHYVTLLMTMKQLSTVLSVIKEARITMHVLLEQVIVTSTQNANNRDAKKAGNIPNTTLTEQQQQNNNAIAKSLVSWQTAVTEFMDEVLSDSKIVPHDVTNLLADRFASEQRRSNAVILISTTAVTRCAVVPARTANAVTRRDQCDADVKQLEYAFLEVRRELDWAVLDANQNDPEMASLMTDEFAQLIARSVHAGAGEAYEQVSAKFRRRSRFVEAVAILCTTKVDDGLISERMRNWIFDLRRYLCKRNETQLNLRQTYYSLRERLHEFYPNEFSTGLATAAAGNARNNNETAAVTASLTDLEVCKLNLLPTDFKLLPSPFGLRPPVTTTKPQNLAPPGTASGRKKTAAPGNVAATNETIAAERAVIGAGGGGGGKEVDKIRQYAKYSRNDPSTLTDEERHQYDYARARAGDALTLFIFERMREWKRGRQYRAVYDAERPHFMKIYFALGQASVNALVRDNNSPSLAAANIGGGDIPRTSPNRFNTSLHFGSVSNAAASPFGGFTDDTFSMDAIFTLNACGWLIERPYDAVEVLLQKEQQFGVTSSPFSPISVASPGGGSTNGGGSRLVAIARRVWLSYQRAIVLGCRCENWQSVQIALTAFWESVHVVLWLVWSSSSTSGGGTIPARLNEMLYVLWKYLLVITQHILGMHESLQQLWTSHQQSSAKAQQNSFSSSAPSAAAAAAVADDIWNGENWLNGCSFLQQPTIAEDRSSVNVMLWMQTCLNCVELAFRQQRWVRVTELCRPAYEMFVRVTHLGDVLFPLDVAARKMILVKQPNQNNNALEVGGSRLLTPIPQHHTTAAGPKVSSSENNSNLLVGIFPKALSAMSSKLMKSGGGISPSQTAAYADAMQVGKSYRQILQQESVILRQFKYCRLLRWRAQLGLWRDRMLAGSKIATSSAAPSSTQQKQQHSPIKNNRAFVPAIPVIAPEFSLMQTTVNDVLHPALIFPLQRDAPFVALSKLVEMLEKYGIKQHSQFLALVYNEMGDTLLMRGGDETDRSRAYTYYNKALECITNVKEAWHNWNEWIARREICDVANFLFEHCGVWGCLMSAMLALKIAESMNATKTNMSMRYNCYAFAALCWLATLRGNFAHPVDLIDFRNYSFGFGEPVAQYLPNLTLLNGWFSHNDSTAAVLLKSLCQSLDEIMCHHDYLLALPLCAILRYLACDVFDLPALLIESWLVKLEALIGLQQYSDAIGVLHMLMEANYLKSCRKFVTECGGGDASSHRPAATATTTSKSQPNSGGNFVPEQSVWFNSAKRLDDAENIDALRFLVEMKFAKTVETSSAYTPEHFHRISILQADLLTGLARSVYGLPEAVDVHGHHERLGGRFYRPVHRGAALLAASAQSPPPANARGTGALSPTPPASGGGPEPRRTSATSAGGGKRGASQHDAAHKSRAGATLSADNNTASSRSGSSSAERRSSTGTNATASPLTNGSAGHVLNMTETDADYDLRAAIGFTDLLTAEAAPSEREIKGLLLKIAYQIYSTAVDELNGAMKNSNDATNFDADRASFMSLGSKLAKKNLLRAAYYRSRRGVATVLGEFHLYDQAFAELMEVVSILSADIDCAKITKASGDRASSAERTAAVEIPKENKRTSTSRSSSAIRKSATGLAARNSSARRPRGFSIGNVDNARRKSSMGAASVVTTGDKGDAFQFTHASVTAAAIANRKDVASSSDAATNQPPQVVELKQAANDAALKGAEGDSAALNDAEVTKNHLLMHKDPLRGGLGLWYTNQMLLDHVLEQQVVLCYGIRTPRFACAGEESSWLDETNVCLDRLIADAQCTAHVEAHAFALLYRMRTQMLSGIDFRELAKCTDAGLNLLRQLPRLSWHAQTTYAELLVLHADVQATLHAPPSYVLQTLVEAHAVLCDQLDSVGVHRVDNCETLAYQHKCHVHSSLLHDVKRKSHHQQPTAASANDAATAAAETQIALPVVIPYTKHTKYLSNVYLTCWALLAKVKLRIGMTFVFDIKRQHLLRAHNNDSDKESNETRRAADSVIVRQMNESLRILQQALQICHDCMLQSAVLESEIAYNCGCISRILYTQFQIGSWRLCMAYLVRAIQRAYCGVHDIKLMHQCYMEIAQLCYDSQEVAATTTGVADFPGDSGESEDCARASIREANQEWQSLAHLAIIFASRSSMAEKSLTDILTRGDCLREAIALSDIDMLPDVILFESIVTYDRRVVDNYMNSLMPATEILDTLLLRSVENVQNGKLVSSSTAEREPALSWIRLVRYIHILRSRLNWNFVISLADIPEFDIEQASAFVAEHNKLAAKAQQQQAKSPETTEMSAAASPVTPTTGPVSILSSSTKPLAAASATAGASWKVAGPNKQTTISIVSPKSGDDSANAAENKRNASNIHESSAERNPLNIRMPAYCAFEEQEYETLQRILISKADGYTRRATAPFPREFIQVLNDSTQCWSGKEDERIRLLGSGRVREDHAREKLQFESILRRINTEETASCVTLECKGESDPCELFLQWHCDIIQPYCHCLFTGIWPQNDKPTQHQQRSPDAGSSMQLHTPGSKAVPPPPQDVKHSKSSKPHSRSYSTAIMSGIPNQALAGVHVNLAGMLKQAELAVSAIRVHRNEQNEVKARKASDLLISIVLQATSEIDKLLKRSTARNFPGLHEIIELFGTNDILVVLREFNELFTPSTGGKALHPFVVSFIMSLFQDVHA